MRASAGEHAIEAAEARQSRPRVVPDDAEDCAMHDFLNSLLSLALEVIGGIVVAVLPFLLLRGYVNRRDRHRWTQEEAECERQWTLQQQVRDLEQQIWEGQLSEEERERRRQARARAAEIRGEARRRLGLPEEA